MTEGNPLKFAPVVSPEDLREHFQKGIGFDEAQLANLHHMKARIEQLADLEELKRIGDFLKSLRLP